MCIEFVSVESKSVGNIHKMLKAVYGDDTMNRSADGMWIKRVKTSDKGQASRGQDFTRKEHILFL
jgi:hypothetical protein